ncbi:MAG: DUF952 domain-containing protein [Candidatus Sericytochromatia bacterium]|nr:DUF952 domain-containing protein [Candidatus Sericytochromatia bacterium]
MIYHIAKTEWYELFKEKDYYESETLTQEKFIHCSEYQQLERTLNLYFKNEKDVLVISIDQDKVIAEIKYEKSADNLVFPHIYGKLNKNAIIKTDIYNSDNQGRFNIK